MLNLQTGATIEADLSIAISYGLGPGGDVDPSTGVAYPGLYQIIFFPFNSGSYTLQVMINRSDCNLIPHAVRV
jgi:hypothetical protein